MLLFLLPSTLTLKLFDALDSPVSQDDIAPGARLRLVRELRGI